MNKERSTRYKSPILLSYDFFDSWNAYQIFFQTGMLPTKHKAKVNKQARAEKSTTISR